MMKHSIVAAAALSVLGTALTAAPAHAETGEYEEYVALGDSGGVDQLGQQIEASESKLVAALEEIHRRSPDARVLMVNYLDAIPERACWPLVSITQSDMTYLHATFAKLNAMVARAAERGGAELVDSFGDSTGHDVCKGPFTRYVEGLGVVSVNGVAVAVPAHPNSAGARSQAASVLSVLGG